LVWAESASSQSSLFSSFSLRQPLNLENLPQTEFTFSRVGSTAGMEWKSCSPDTGPIPSSPQTLTARFTKFVSQVFKIHRSAARQAKAIQREGVLAELSSDSPL
jgi:hypothetical protein